MGNRCDTDLGETVANRDMDCTCNRDFTCQTHEDAEHCPEDCGNGEEGSNDGEEEEEGSFDEDCKQNQEMCGEGSECCSSACNNNFCVGQNINCCLVLDLFGDLFTYLHDSGHGNL